METSSPRTWDKDENYEIADSLKKETSIFVKLD